MSLPAPPVKHVVAEAAIDLVGAGIADDGVGEVAAREDQPGRAGGIQILDLGPGAHVEVDARIDRVDATAGGFDHGIAGIVDVVDIVADPAVHGIDAGAAIENVVACIAKESVDAGAAEERVVTRAAEEPIVAAEAIKSVVAAEALEPVAGIVAGQHVIGLAAGQGVVERADIEDDVLDIGEVIARHHEVAGDHHRIGALACMLDDAVAGRDIIGVAADPALQPVGAGTAVEHVVAGSAFQGVCAATAGQPVIAAFALEMVVRVVADQRVAEGRADQAFDAGEAVSSRTVSSGRLDRQAQIRRDA